MGFTCRLCGHHRTLDALVYLQGAFVLDYKTGTDATKGTSYEVIFLDTPLNRDDTIQFLGKSHIANFHPGSNGSVVDIRS